MLPKSTIVSMGLLEVKCTMKDSVSDVSYLKVVRDKLQLHRSHQYYEQCVSQMGLTGRSGVTSMCGARMTVTVK